ncbi:hypothetical protein BABINDRAFT_163517 [Babjeviella inositovora NRRL Y-12698]|uniref:Ubiquinone biosynthesis protein n=1 Tax=Babjeviella inositovora NRRL Y-12698 TaxID=984486 RepID=A0A1E3QIH4_9ASCO|nr:uncharacterized protein BABINDRAFT_163517 [Babjeviella inositovora NRRL Y-12698]ODQ77513.1 hypothetical protein BABINDRAFT_163517 [Babjeviella inositovora NRRL Y-12698]
MLFLRTSLTRALLLHRTASPFSATSAPVLRAFYQSSDHPDRAFYAPHESQILDYALTNPVEGVPVLGFTEQPLINALRAHGKSQSMATSFQTANSAPMAIMLYHMKTQRAKMVAEHAKTLYELPHVNGLSQYDRLQYLLIARLRDNVAVAGQLQGGLAQLVQPANIAASLSELYDLADDLCHYSGDKSNDFAWYAKRGSVAKIYVLCELHQAGLPAGEFAQVEAFVKEQVSEMENMAYAYNSMEEWGYINMIGLVNLIRSQLTRS